MRNDIGTTNHSHLTPAANAEFCKNLCIERK